VAVAVASLTDQPLAPIGVLVAVLVSSLAVAPYTQWRKRRLAAGQAATGHVAAGQVAAGVSTGPWQGASDAGTTTRATPGRSGASPRSEDRSQPRKAGSLAISSR
jgi:hypothetical protein